MHTAGDRIRSNRERLSLNQSDVSAYLTFAFRQSWNQARINEFENGKRAIKPDVSQTLEAFFKTVERLRRQKRHWTDIFKL